MGEPIPIGDRDDLAGAVDLAGGRDFARPDPSGGDLGAPPGEVFASPGPAPALWGGKNAAAFTVTLAADVAGAEIYYTTDGSAPSASSPHGPSPLDVAVASDVTVRFYAANAAGATAEKSESYGLNAALQTGAGYLVGGVKLDGTSPVARAAPGQKLTAGATWQVWVQSSCPGCRAQLVYGLGTSDQGCLYDFSPGLYPGTGAMTGSFEVTAPSVAGLYELRVAHIEELSCADAVAKNALGTRPNVTRIGYLLVQ